MPQISKDKPYITEQLVYEEEGGAALTWQHYGNGMHAADDDGRAFRVVDRRTNRTHVIYDNPTTASEVADQLNFIHRSKT